MSEARVRAVFRMNDKGFLSFEIHAEDYQDAGVKKVVRETMLELQKIRQDLIEKRQEFKKQLEAQGALKPRRGRPRKVPLKDSEKSAGGGR